jgi:hypothetical protein
MDGLHLAAESWRLSREEWVNYPWEDVYVTDCPATEMPSCVLHLHEITMIEREILASSRSHVMWARTSVEHPIKYRVPVMLAKSIDLRRHDLCREKMEEMRDDGLHRDEWRRLMPVSAVTSLVMRISFRDVIKYALYFDYLAGRVHPILKELMENMRDELLVVADKFTGLRARTERTLKSMKLAKFLHEGRIEPASLVDAGSFWVANVEVPLWIRAHMVRHRPLAIADEFFQMLLRPDILDMPINESIRMEIGATKDFWGTIISKRTCWLLQTTLAAEKDPWQTVIDYFGDYGQDVLPCVDGHCPYEADAHLRVTDYDPSVPCPIYMGFKGIDKTPYLDELRIAAKGRSPFWMEIINS